MAEDLALVSVHDDHDDDEISFCLHATLYQNSETTQGADVR